MNCIVEGCGFLLARRHPKDHLVSFLRNGNGAGLHVVNLPGGWILQAGRCRRYAFSREEQDLGAAPLKLGGNL